MDNFSRAKLLARVKSIALGQRMIGDVNIEPVINLSPSEYTKRVGKFNGGTFNKKPSRFIDRFKKQYLKGKNFNRDNTSF